MPELLSPDFCFCTLALRAKYRQLARQLAVDLEQYAPGVILVVGTDRPQDFSNCRNVWAFQLKSRGLLHCYHDKRFVLDQARSRFRTVVQLDADTRMIGQISDIASARSTLAAVHVEPLLLHVQRYSPERLPHLRKLAEKLEIDLAQVSFVGEALFALVAETAQSKAFIEQWDWIARYLELHGIHAGEGNAIGLAAAKVGLEITQPDWLAHINDDRRHLDFSESQVEPTFWQELPRRLRYHLRLTRARINAIRHFDFFYR
ncbi:hypothetical protein IQ266_16795 [filamentous cyanobacterium LEGE 11480]|uniref:Uncharacterized protein n=1 Tax=Romeriopsis navalis LEGE 11480 TaxID=2777977 RepID=A0A928VSH8_9CYAN|nr:hypothetical protein [Romeriopsis navalis LEGE 11480]